MKMITKLTKANCEKYGIKVAPELDFTDDGNRFRGFTYNGLEISQLFTHGELYLDIHVPYDTNFTWDEWFKTEESKLTGMFNGYTGEFDIEVFVGNMDRIITKIKEMNENSFVCEDDVKEAKELVLKEINERERLIEDMKSNFKWWNAYPYDLKRAKEYLDCLEKETKSGYSILNDIDSYNIRRKKDLINSARKGCAIGGKFYMECIKEIMERMDKVS